MCLPILVRLISSHTHSVLKLTVTEMQNRLITDAKNLESSKTFCLKIKTKVKTLICVLEAPRDQDFFLKDNITESTYLFSLITFLLLIRYVTV